MKTDYQREERIEDFLRNHVWLLLFVTITTAAVLYAGIAGSLFLFNQGKYWSIFISGLLAHSFFVITMHDGAHRSITRTHFDFVIMNVCAGLILLPLYTELFKKYHLLHHAHTNTANDPLWSGKKKTLFDENRRLYAFLQCLPFVFNLFMLLRTSDDRKQKKLPAPKVNLYLVVLSFLIADVIIWLALPSIWFVLGTFMVMTTLGAIRYWGEHMGIEEGKQSNTHWFPLGMGIGNHEVHHDHPDYSWLTLTIGLLFRKKDTNPFRSVYRIFFNRSFHHYKREE